MRLKESCDSCGGQLEQGVEVAIDINALEDIIVPAPAEVLSAYVGFLRAYHLWMHGAHNVVKGPSFAGDHIDLYGKIYSEVQGHIDVVIEKGVGVYQDEGIACPMTIVADASLILDAWESPAGQTSERIASLSLEYTKQLVKIGEGTAQVLEEMESLTYGMDNMMAGLVDTHENYVYLLQQRTK
jgi:DNA-binding ferritin-like protein